MTKIIFTDWNIPINYLTQYINMYITEYVDRPKR